MRNKKPEKPVSAKSFSDPDYDKELYDATRKTITDKVEKDFALPEGKFEIRLPATEENKAFADKCSAAYLSGTTVLYREINHHVYHWGFDTSEMTVDTKPDYVIGLVRAE